MPLGIAEAVKVAHESGTIVSYDLNFRSKLWSSKEAIETTKPLVPYIDCLIGNEEDFEQVLGYQAEGVDVHKAGALDVGPFKKMVERVVKDYKNIKVVGTTLREVTSGLVNNWSAILWHEGTFYESRRYDNLEIEDRVGGGDGFSSGFAYGFLNGKTPQECVDLGAAHGALLQTTRGDTSQIDLESEQLIHKVLEQFTRHRTTVIVTHDQEEALALADRVAVMSRGRVEQVGSPTDVYDNPATLFVSRFVGTTNLLAGRVARIMGASRCFSICPS